MVRIEALTRDAPARIRPPAGRDESLGSSLLPHRLLTAEHMLPKSTHTQTTRARAGRLVCLGRCGQDQVEHGSTQPPYRMDSRPPSRQCTSYASPEIVRIGHTRSAKLLIRK